MYVQYTYITRIYICIYVYMYMCLSISIFISLSQHLCICVYVCTSSSIYCNTSQVTGTKCSEHCQHQTAGCPWAIVWTLEPTSICESHHPGHYSIDDFSTFLHALMDIEDTMLSVFFRRRQSRGLRPSD